MTFSERYLGTVSINGYSCSQLLQRRLDNDLAKRALLLPVDNKQGTPRKYLKKWSLFFFIYTKVQNS